MVEPTGAPDDVMDTDAGGGPAAGGSAAGGPAGGVATGVFTPSFTPLDSDDPGIGRARVAKTFTGDLVGDARAEMLSVGTEVEGSAAYVAIDRFTGACHGRSGGFLLVHTGLMARGEGSLQVSVVPDSGTGELAGITGTFAIDIVGGEHRYTFTYALATPTPSSTSTS